MTSRKVHWQLKSILVSCRSIKIVLMVPTGFSSVIEFDTARIIHGAEPIS